MNHLVALPYPVENPRINSLEELAGLMSNLHEIVSIDSGPAYMASAMELPLTVLLSSVWKFGIDKDQTPFLPTAMIIRNGPGGRVGKTVEKAIEHINSKYGKRQIHMVGD